MDFRQIRYFLMVEDQCNFTKAAELLHVTQPTLSQQIAELEDQLGVKLFYREKKRISLTPAGKVFAEEAHKINDQYDQCLLRMATFSKGREGTITIGVLEPFENTFLPELIKSFRKNYPNIKILWRQYQFEQLNESLLKGKSDINFTIMPKNVKIQGTIKNIIADDCLAIVAPKGTEIDEMDGFFNPILLIPLLSRTFFLWKEWYRNETEQLVRKLQEFNPNLKIEQVDRMSFCLMNTLSENGYTILPYRMISDIKQSHFSYIALPLKEAELDTIILFKKDNKNPCLPYIIQEVESLLSRKKTLINNSILS